MSIFCYLHFVNSRLTILNGLFYSWVITSCIIIIIPHKSMYLNDQLNGYSLLPNSFHCHLYSIISTLEKSKVRFSMYLYGYGKNKNGTSIPAVIVANNWITYTTYYPRIVAINGGTRTEKITFTRAYKLIFTALLCASPPRHPRVIHCNNISSHR